MFLLLTIALFICGFHADTLTAYATLEELEAEAEARKSLPIQSNDIENWPVGPQIGAQSAILMDANTGVILYSKNIHERLYPASTTKIMTCLLAMERGNLDDMVEFSHDAVFTVPADGSNMGMDTGEAITLEECLYGILVGSANEVSNAVAEYISGSIDDFVTLMNERAEEIGCKDTHFVNANGLHDTEHYTSTYDLAPYNGILGGKTGYTDNARQTLVTCAEQNGMRLVCIVFKEESPAQFTDTEELFNYGFHNFQVMNISENEDRYNIEATGFLQIGDDIFGSSKPILSIDTDSYVIVPNVVSFSDLDSEIDYSISDENRVAQIRYSYHDMYVGSAYLNLVTESGATYEFDTNITTSDVSVERVEPESDKEPAQEKDTIFINVKKVLITILVLAASLIFLFVLRALIANRKTAKRRNNRVKRKQRRRSYVHSDFDDFDF